MQGLAPIDGLALFAIGLTAAGYATALLAMGGVLFAAIFARHADPDVLRLARRMAALAALAGLAILAARIGLRAMRISGLGLDAATDPAMLSLVWHSPLGTAAIWRGLGEAAILTVLASGPLRHLALPGAGAIAISYAQVGHSLGEPRGLLAALVTLHLLAAAFWVGALLPLRRAATGPGGAGLLHRFGTLAAVAVGALIAAGLGLAWILTGSVGGLLGTAHGRFLLAKVAVVTGLLGLAALNKWRLVPALRDGHPGARAALRHSIALEAAAILLILLATATITTVTVPPANL